MVEDDEGLTEPQIERLVQRYRLEHARAEAVVRFVEDKLRRALGKARVQALIASRSKDPESLRGKLVRKRAAPKSSRVLDDASTFAVGLRSEFGQGLLDVARSYEDNASPVIRAILQTGAGSDGDH